ncbi:pilus assembly PilX N-terminal domain-containing protein [candidate division KSB1 bacterium]|nr:pilus assembly PilX N-terminal domain-containing protein [candidate division KSB1 bacterium]
MLTNERGGVLILALVIISVLIILGLAQVKLVSLTYKNNRNQLQMVKAEYAAEAGIERTIVEYLLDDVKNSWGSLAATTIFTDEPFSGGSYSVTVEGLNSTTAIAHSIGVWKAVQATVDVTITADWNQEPPIVQRSVWVE